MDQAARLFKGVLQFVHGRVEQYSSAPEACCGFFDFIKARRPGTRRECNEKGRAELLVRYGRTIKRRAGRVGHSVPLGQILRPIVQCMQWNSVQKAVRREYNHSPQVSLDRSDEILIKVLQVSFSC